ncbi:MAG: LuxR C-terminal-related transcriptional regulator [Deinococcota bacterium]
MSSFILASKLNQPQVRPELVSRQRLLTKLDAALNQQLSLVSASAGFGKTTLVSQWLAQLDRPVAWLSLDTSESSPSQFVRYLLASLQTVQPDIGAGINEILEVKQDLLAVLASVMNDLAALPEPFVVVLDDFHLINTQDVNTLLEFILAHQPPHMHLVILSREDPALPLARLRVRHQLSELRASDLRFSVAETADFFNQLMGLDLSTEDVAKLDTRTEGWVASLQLAALSLQGQADTSAFIQTFSGDHRYVLDYLLEEVLNKQDDHTRAFLLKTSVLKRLNAGLCDLLTGQDTSQQRLEQLERANLFLIPLDDKREWFRYHHLFADVLVTHLQQTHPDVVPSLYQQASCWCEEQGYQEDAISYALAANDTERAANLVELAWAELDQTLRSETWLSWFERLPQQVRHSRPVLRLGYAWALLNRGELEAGDAVLQQLDAFLQTTPQADMVIADEAQFADIAGALAEARAFHAQAKGDVAGSVRHAKNALELAPQDNIFRRASALSLLALANWASGELEAAFQGFSESADMLIQQGNTHMAIVAPFLLADIRIAQGQLGYAEGLCTTTLSLATSQPHLLPGTNELYIGLAEVALARANYPEALAFLDQAEALGPTSSISSTKYRYYLAKALIKQAQGEVEVALNFLAEAEFWYIRSPIANFRAFDAVRARIYIQRGQLAQAADWANRQPFTAKTNLTYLDEYVHISWLNVVLAGYQQQQDDALLEQANALSEQLISQAETQKRITSLIELLVLQARIQLVTGHQAQALASLDKALALAEPEGFQHIFFQAGQTLIPLLKELASSSTFAASLLVDMEPSPSYAFDAVDGLLEPLSERELEILRLLPTGRSSPDLASYLHISVNTVKTHLKNIYSKLGVHKRHEAVTRAQELEII